MKKLRRIADALAAAAVLTALLAFALAEPAAGQPKAERRRYVVAAMGDSLTDPRSFGGKYLDVLRQRCPGSRFDSYGVGGQMVNQMRRRFARDVLGQPKADEDNPKPRYTHVIVLGGLNDILSDRSASRTNDKIIEDLSAMFKLAKDGGLSVVAVTLPPWAGFRRYHNPRRQASTLLINRWLRRQAGQGGTVDAVLDAYPLLSCGKPAFLCQRYALKDQVHWSQPGHEVIGRALHQQIFADCR